jgi:hypothetical protein
MSTTADAMGPMGVAYTSSSGATSSTTCMAVYSPITTPQDSRWKIHSRTSATTGRVKAALASTEAPAQVESRHSCGHVKSSSVMSRPFSRPLRTTKYT